MLKLFEGVIAVIVKVLAFFKIQKDLKEIKVGEAGIKKDSADVKKVEATFVKAQADIAKVDVSTEKKVGKIEATSSIDDLSKDYDNEK